MASEESFEITSEGKLKAEEPALVSVPSPAVDDKAGIERIYEMIQDPEVPIADISRLIALEIVNIMKKMSPKEFLDRSLMPSQRDLNDQVKAYRELQRTLTESDALAKKDVLNLDGEKFKFVFSSLLLLFQKAMKDGGVDDLVSHNIMQHFGDLVRGNESDLRIDLNKIGTGR
jgi:hypothetical protein